MPPELLTALRQIRQTMGDAILHDERRVSSFLADLLGNRHPGERRLLLLLLTEGIPRMIQSGQLKEGDIAAKARHLSQAYFLDNDKLAQGIGVWYAVVLDVPLPKPPKPQPTGPSASGPQSGPASAPPPRPGASPNSGGGPSALGVVVLVFAGILLLTGLLQRTNTAPGARFQQTTRDETTPSRAYEAPRPQPHPAPSSGAAAQQQDAFVQSEQAVKYYRGEGVDKDSDLAQEWGSRAAGPLLELARNGDGRACYHVGRLHQLGLGLVKSDEQAAFWYRRAAEQGVAAAQNNLGFFYKYEMGGLPKDDGQALYWFDRAARQGDVRGQVNLGHMYAEGRGVARDAGQAAFWYRKAADQGNAWAQNKLGVLHEQGLPGLRQDMGEALRWYRQAAANGSALAMHNLGDLYRQGKGVAQDGREAFRWYKKAADAGHAIGFEDMADCYRDGVGVSPDWDEARRLYREAAGQGRKSAERKLRDMDEEGCGTVRPGPEAKIA